METRSTWLIPKNLCLSLQLLQKKTRPLACFPAKPAGGLCLSLTGFRYRLTKWEGGILQFPSLMRALSSPSLGLSAHMRSLWGYGQFRSPQKAEVVRTQNPWLDS